VLAIDLSRINRKEAAGTGQQPAAFERAWVRRARFYLLPSIKRIAAARAEAFAPL
jgi:hypothetical protein